MKNFIILDTETTNSIDCPLMYDIGWTVWNADTDEILATKSFVVAEIFLDEQLMESAYFIEKVPQYWKDIKNGKRKLKRLYNIRKELDYIDRDEGTDLRNMYDSLDLLEEDKREIVKLLAKSAYGAVRKFIEDNGFYIRRSC